MSRRANKKNEDGFSLAFLDVMACGLGAVIVIFILVDFNAFSVDPSEEIQKLDSDINATQTLTAQLQQEIETLQKAILQAQTDSQRAQSKQNATSSVLDETMRQIGEQAARIESLEQEYETLSTTEVPEANIKIDAQDTQTFIAGMNVEGSDIVLMFDQSASMMGRNLTEVLKRLAWTDTQKQASPKWQRSLSTVRWLLARIPTNAMVSVFAYSDGTTTLGGQKAFSANNDGAFTQVLNDLDGLVPDGGTDLEQALSHVIKTNPSVSDVYIVTDGLPTLGDGLPLRCRNFISSNKAISSDCRQALFIASLKQAPRGVRVHVILLPIEGDPYAPAMYWNWTRVTNGTFLSPAEDWP